LARQIEDAGRERNAESVDKIIDRLETEIKNMVNNINELLGERVV
jgi:hypothetical protein